MEAGEILQYLSQGGMVAVGGWLVYVMVGNLRQAREDRISAEKHREEREDERDSLHRQEREETRTLFADQLGQIANGIGGKVDRLAVDVGDVKATTARIEDVVRRTTDTV